MPATGTSCRPTSSIFSSKPFTPEQLVSTVDAVFDQSKAHVPVRKLREQSATVHSVRTTALTDAREMATVVSAAALARHETNRVHTARAAMHARARVTTVVRDIPAPQHPAEPVRLRASLNTAVAQRQTGVFRVRAGNAPATELYLENGQIVVLASQEAACYSEDAEGVVPPKISPATLDDAPVGTGADRGSFHPDPGIAPACCRRRRP